MRKFDFCINISPFEIKLNANLNLRSSISTARNNDGPMGIRTPVIGSEGQIECDSIWKDDLDKFLKLRSINGISKRWLHDVRVALENYLDHLDWSVDENKTLDYLKILQTKYTTTSYRKRVYQIRKFLTFKHIEWAVNIKPPSEPNYTPKRLSKDDIKHTLSYLTGNKFFKQIKAIILLGATSGIRAEEMYQLKIEDIDLDNRIIHINHNPTIGQSTKTKMSRLSFFDIKAQEALKEYITYFERNVHLKVLFSQSHITRLFKNAPIQVKDLRKYFSQEWDRRGGPTSIKKILMGHSLKGDVDLMHYNYQSEEDLKKIYDKVMGNDTNEGIL